MSIHQKYASMHLGITENLAILSESDFGAWQTTTWESNFTSVTGGASRRGRSLCTVPFSDILTKGAKTRKYNQQVRLQLQPLVSLHLVGFVCISAVTIVEAISLSFRLLSFAASLRLKPCRRRPETWLSIYRQSAAACHKKK